MHRLSLGLACFAIAFGACRDDRPQPRADGSAGPDQAGPSGDGSIADIRAADVAGDRTADVAADGTGAPDAADAAGDIAPDAMAADGASDTSAPPDAAPSCGPAPRDMLCLSYCDGMGRLCPGQFPNAEACRSACNAPTSSWACGQPGDVTGNSLFCRLSHMALAGVGDAATRCPNAGPASPACQ